MPTKNNTEINSDSGLNHFSWYAGLSCLPYMVVIHYRDPRINLFPITIIFVTLLVFWVNAAGKDEATWILKLQHSDRWDSLLEIMRTVFSCSKASCFDLHHGWWCFHCTHWNPCVSLLAISRTCKDGHFTSVQIVLYPICFPCLWSRKWIRMRGW